MLLQQFLTIDIAAKILLFCYWQCFQIMQFSTIIRMTNRKKINFRGSWGHKFSNAIKGSVFRKQPTSLAQKRTVTIFSSGNIGHFKFRVRSIIVIIDNRKRFKHGIKFFG